jgi:hypothetical protein
MVEATEFDLSEAIAHIQDEAVTKQVAKFLEVDQPLKARVTTA